MLRALFAVLLLAAPAALAVRVEEVKDPRPAHQVLDQTEMLSTDDITRIDAVSHGDGELLVVVLNRLDGHGPRDFTTRLFNRLGVDSKSRDRGVLFLVSLGDRAAEIVVGDGHPVSVTSLTDAIMADTIVPAFKRGDARGAVVAGAEALSRLVLNPSSTPPPAPSSASSAFTSSPSEASFSRARASSKESPYPWVLGGAGLMGATGLIGRAWLRRRPRKCPACANVMVRLDESTDDAHLSASEQKEEALGSVDYDVWLCEACSHTEKLRYGALFTRYSKCKQCAARTLKTTSRTVTPATVHSTGRAEVTEDCQHCSYRNTYYKTIPRKTQSSGSSSSRSSWGSSSSSRSSSSSSRSSGSSSGRGSSGRW